MSNHSKMLVALSAVVLLIGAFSVKSWVSGSAGESGSPQSVTGEAVVATVYKSPDCSCCASYVKYLEKKGFSVEVINKTDMYSVKDEYGIPNNMESCHTTVVGEYVAEGHIPAAAIEKLLTESPDISGIAMPGMPQGSPGMPGFKSDIFTVYSFSSGGATSKFMEL